MKRTSSPTVTPQMAAHIKFLIAQKGLFQHQAAALCGVNQGRVSEIMKGLKYPSVLPAQGPFPT